MMKIFTWCFLPLLLPSLAFAAGFKLKTDKGTPVLVNADNYAGDSEAHVMELTGHVHVIYSEQAISCDHAIIHDLTNEIEADGHLIIDSPTIHAEGERANLNYKTNLGTLDHAFVVSGQIMLEGETIRKIGPEEYIAERGNYTACTTCPPAWGFRARQIDAQLGGYARLKSVLFEVLNFPILWLPYLIVPLKSDRQSGFLIPRISIAPSTTDSRGYQIGFSEPYFWAIDRSQDATFNLSSNPANGIKGTVDYRYMLSEKSRGDLQAGAIHDKLFNGAKNLIYPDLTAQQQIDQKVQTLPDDFTRWFFHYDHHYELPDGFVQNTRVDLLSDLRYSIDYPDDAIPISGERAIDNRFTLTKNTELTHSSIDASYYVNLLKARPINGPTILESNGDAVHRAPELRYSIVNTKIGSTNFLFHADADYVHFARQDLSYDDLISRDPNVCGGAPKTDPVTGYVGVPTCYDGSRGKNRTTGVLNANTGQFDPELDAIRTGDRFDLHPEVTYPFQIGRVFDIVPAVSFRYMQYNLDASPDSDNQTPSIAEDPNVVGFNTHPSRSYFTESVSTRTRLSTVWGTNDGDPRETRYKHEFEPEVRLTALNGMNETQSTFLNSNDHTPEFLSDQPITDTDILGLDPTTSQPRTLQFDYNDRIIHRNIVTGLLTNKIIKKTWSKAAPTATNPDFKPLTLETSTDEANYLQIIDFKIWQSYDIDAASTSGPRFPWSDVDGLFDFRFQNIESNILLRFYPYHNVTSSSIRTRIFDQIGNFMQLTYSQQFKITENVHDSNYDQPNSHEESIGIGLGFNRKYLKLLGDINLNPRDFRNSYDINYWDAFVLVTPPGNCWGVGFKFIHVLGQNGTSSTINFDYQFGGGAPTATTPAPGTPAPAATPAHI